MVFRCPHSLPAVFHSLAQWSLTLTMLETVWFGTPFGFDYAHIHTPVPRLKQTKMSRHCMQTMQTVQEKPQDLRAECCTWLGPTQKQQSPGPAAHLSNPTDTSSSPRPSCPSWPGYISFWALFPPDCLFCCSGMGHFIRRQMRRDSEGTKNIGNHNPKMWPSQLCLKI